MSGQPLNNPSDNNKFRQQYLANLALRAKLDDKDLQANKIFIKTGQTPSQPTDTRTTAEKYADVERMKIDVRQGLSAIMDGAGADSVVNSLDAPQLSFLVAQMPNIVNIIKPRYAYGITAPLFLPFFAKYMEKEMRNIGVEDALQQSTGNAILLGTQMILGMINQADLVAIRQRIDVFGRGNRVVEAIRRDLDTLQGIIPTPLTLQALRGIANPITRAEIQQDLNGALRDLPSMGIINMNLEALEDARQASDGRQQERLLEQLHQMLATQPSSEERMRMVQREIDEAEGKRAEDEDYQQRLEAYTQAKRRGATQYIPRIEPPPSGLKNAPLGSPEHMYRRKAPVEFELLSPDEFNSIQRKSQMLNYLDKVIDMDKSEFRHLGITEDGNPRLSIADLMKMYADNFQIIQGIHQYYYSNPQQYQMQQGMPLADWEHSRRLMPPSRSASTDRESVSRSNTPRGRGFGIHIDNSAGIKAGARYVPFGKYVIHNHKLLDDIVSIRRPKGSSITGFPTHRQSTKVGHIVRKIVAGGHPTFDELNELGEDDKNYLHKLVKSANIGDKISVPSPNRDQMDTDCNTFNIMKGEIMSGNDSVEYIKKFKILLVKMTNNGLIPRSQSQDILMELVSMGF
jgi:hypothetical protein